MAWTKQQQENYIRSYGALNAHLNDARRALLNGASSIKNTFPGGGVSGAGAIHIAQIRCHAKTVRDLAEQIDSERMRMTEKGFLL